MEKEKEILTPEEIEEIIRKLEAECREMINSQPNPTEKSEKAVEE